MNDLQAPKAITDFNRSFIKTWIENNEFNNEFIDKLADVFTEISTYGVKQINWSVKDDNDAFIKSTRHEYVTLDLPYVVSIKGKIDTPVVLLNTGMRSFVPIEDLVTFNYSKNYLIFSLIEMSSALPSNTKVVMVNKTLLEEIALHTAAYVDISCIEFIDGKMNIYSNEENNDVKYDIQSRDKLEESYTDIYKPILEYCKNDITITGIYFHIFMIFSLYNNSMFEDLFRTHKTKYVHEFCDILKDY